MNEKIYLAFDIDGTIFDVSPIAVDSFELGVANYRVRSGKSGIKIPDRDKIINQLGIPIKNIFENLYPELASPVQAEIADLTTDAFVELIRMGGGTVFPDVENVIKSFHEQGFVNIVASNGRSEYVNAILETHGLLRYFSAPFIYPDATRPDKTSVVRYYIDYFSSARVIMIGDRSTDRVAARENGIPFIGCSFGHAGDDEISDADVIVHSFEEISSAVESIVKSKFFV